jgi:putative nucleotidyltransferase with HDIG domain
MRRGAREADVGAAQPALTGTTGEAWRARPALATAIGVLALGGPAALLVGAVYGASRAVVPPVGSRALTIGWWVGRSAIATLSLVAAGRLARRLLPLAALMRLSLVFPDGAPSRFRIALRTGTVDTLEQRLADARRGAADRTPLESARLLLELVAHLDEHDPLTRGHSERVRAYSQSIGRELGLDPRELDLLNWAALLHDVGKGEGPHEILAKSGRPTESGWEALRAHPVAGAQLAAPLRAWLGEWSTAIEQHHERWDGEGYPYGLAGEEISLAGRIVAVADVFDVMTSTRSYKRPASVADARRELSHCAGTQFDPDVVRAFLAISVRQSRLAAPLAWLAQTAVLARLPLMQTAGGLTAGVAAVAVGAGAGVQTHPPRLAVMPPPVVRPVARPAAEHEPVAVRSARPATAHTAAKEKPKARPRVRNTPVARTSPPAPKIEAPSAKLKGEAVSAPAPDPPPTPSPPTAVPTVKPPTKPQSPLEVLPTLPAPPVAPPEAPELPPLPLLPTGDGSSPTDDLTDGLTDVTDDVTDDVTTAVDDVVSVTDPETPRSDDLSDTVADVSDTVDDLVGLVAPADQDSPDDDGGGGLLGPLLGG